MKKKSGFFRKIFSLNRLRRKFGSKRVTKIFNGKDYSQLKITKVCTATSRQTRGSHKDIYKHFKSLEEEFCGKSELLLYHAVLIVLIRRESDLANNLDKFFHLWEIENEWLIKNLNLRWLTSAADTFADHGKNSDTKLLAIAVSLLVNTVKSYESENYLCNREAQDIIYDQKKIEHVQSNLVHLFEGISCYTVGTDDTLRNMIWRIQDINKDNIIKPILLELLNRLSILPTAFGRMRKIHTRAKTKWWTD